MKLTGEKVVLDLQEQIKSDIIWETHYIITMTYLYPILWNMEIKYQVYNIFHTL